MNVEGASELLALVLSEDGDDLDAKSVFHSDENGPGYWEQVGGDYGDAWLYGGDWYNPLKRRVVHFEGVEDEKEIDPDDVPVPEQMMAKLMAKTHDPYLDTEEAKEDPAWHARMLRDEERERENVIGHYQYARAAFLNDRTQQTFWDFDVPDEVPHHLQRYEENVRQSLGPEGGYEDWPVYQKMLEIGRYTGYGDMASIFKMNKIEAQQFFGFSL